MNCIIVDDDIVSIKHLEIMIAKNPYLNYLGHYISGKDVINALDDLVVDLIFLDVEMPEMSGFEVLQHLKDIPSIIFISSKKEYAADAFSSIASDYLVKPIQPDRFTNSIKLLAEKKKIADDGITIHDSFFVKDKNRLVQIFVNDIIYIEAISDYVQVFTDTKKYMFLASLKNLERRLPHINFKRVHRSYIVNKYKIIEVDENVISVKDKNIPISRSNKADFMNWINVI
jgi:DNA-binding LytR/AlgR family response regulator